MAANATTDLEVLRSGGECVIYGSGQPTMNLPFLPLIAKNVQLKFFIVYNLAEADRALAQGALQRMLARGDLLHNIAARLPLAQAVQAHEMVEQGRAVGNVVISLPQD